MLMLMSMNLTLMQGDNGSANAKHQRWIISTTKQATSIKLTTTVGQFAGDPDMTLIAIDWALKNNYLFVGDLDFEIVYIA